jgi:hypothetical protein
MQKILFRSLARSQISSVIVDIGHRWWRRRRLKARHIAAFAR